MLSVTGRLILAILRVAFSALRYQTDLSSKQYATSAAASIAYCSSLKSVWHLNAENVNPQNRSNLRPVTEHLICKLQHFGI